MDKKQGSTQGNGIYMIFVHEIYNQLYSIWICLKMVLYGAV